MNNMKCQTNNHLEKEINTLCLDKNCKNCRFCCLLCIKNEHKAHLDKLIEVNQINTFIEDEKNKKVQFPETCTCGQQQIIQGLEKLMDLVDILQKIIKERIEKIKSQNLQDYLKKSSNSYRQKNNSLLSQGSEYWSQLLEGILQYVEVDNCVITKSKQGQLSQMEEIEIKNIKQSEQSLQSMINQINQTQVKIGKWCFQENRKHADIVIIDECTIKQTQNSFAIAYATEGFDPSCQSYAFTFNIQKLTNSIFVGVGNDEGIKASSYDFSTYDKLGHGQYMIHNTSHTIHHSDEQFKWKANKISFTTGDKIQIKYNHVTKVLEFRKSSDQNTVVQMPITDMTKMLYPCAFLYQPDSQVQLAEY